MGTIWSRDGRPSSWAPHFGLSDVKKKWCDFKWVSRWAPLELGKLQHNFVLYHHFFLVSLTVANLAWSGEPKNNFMCNAAHERPGRSDLPYENPNLDRHANSTVTYSSAQSFVCNFTGKKCSLAFYGTIFRIVQFFGEESSVRHNPP